MSALIKDDTRCKSFLYRQSTTTVQLKAWKTLDSFIKGNLQDFVPIGGSRYLVLLIQLTIDNSLSRAMLNAKLCLLLAYVKAQKGFLMQASPLKVIRRNEVGSNLNLNRLCSILSLWDDSNHRPMSSCRPHAEHIETSSQNNNN